MLTKQQFLDMIHAIEVSSPLGDDHECNGRYNWPERWRILKESFELLFEFFEDLDNYKGNYNENHLEK
jgi:hypothetical protein